MEPPIPWLLDSPAWLQLRVRADLLGESPTSPSNRELRARSLEDPQIAALIGNLADWPSVPLTSHKSAGHPIHQLEFLADLGFCQTDAGIQTIIDRILGHVSVQGPFSVAVDVPVHFGGSGQESLAWALCDAPLPLYVLIQFGLQDHPAVEKAASFLAGLVRENGYPCAVSPELGKFRGPGRKEDPCPYANLIMLQALSGLNKYEDTPAVRWAGEAALNAWAERRERHPYMFYMGTDFCKLKAPLVWYDILHVLDVLTRFPQYRADPRLLEMVGIVCAKMDGEGKFTPESVWTAWKDWEFGQKKAPSRWLTFLVWRVLSRVGID
ncbi:MAG: hypothetical protein ABFD44_07440 [Anaerolineaceae bacterium]